MADRPTKENFEESPELGTNQVKKMDGWLSSQVRDG